MCRGTDIRSSEKRFSEPRYVFPPETILRRNSVFKKPSRSLFGIIAVFALAFTLATCGGGGGQKTGSGIATDPWLIYTAEQLRDLALDVNVGLDKSGQYFKLARNIDLSDYSGGKGWTPIGGGARGNPFRGNFDGGGYVVSNLFINYSGAGEDYVGLFGILDGATVENLGVVIAGSITGYSYVGAVAGMLDNNSVINNCHVTGDVTGNHDYVGAVAGALDNNSSISNSHSSGDVTGSRNIGGVAGALDNNSAISDSYSTGDVEGGLNIGGVAGYVGGGSAISDSYSTGDVTNGGSGYAGGIAGRVSVGGAISNCYATGDVNGVGPVNNYIGGIAGMLDNNSAISNSYATGDVNGGDGAQIGGIAGALDNNCGINNSHATGDVAGRDYIGGVAGWNRNSSISNSYSTGNVEGSFDWVGGIAGHTNIVDSGVSSISNCYATGDVKGRDQVGGIVGENASNGSTISDCYSTGNITGSQNVGGVAGYVFRGPLALSNCYATGEVKGWTQWVGGIAGRVGVLATVKNCAALNSAITYLGSGAPSSFGRVVGFNSGTLTNNVARDDMTVISAVWTATFVTGADATDTGIHGMGIPVGAAAGETNNQATYSAAAPFAAGVGGLGWDFVGVAPDPPIWKWDATLTLPILYWQ